MKLVSRLGCVAVAAILIMPVGASAGRAAQDASGDGGGGGACTHVRHAIVTDIDNTMTGDNLEWVKQWFVPSYDPVERSSAAELMRRWAAKGFWVVYVTGRNDDFPFPDGETSRQITVDWLAHHGFPLAADRTMVFQSPEILSGIYPRPYKAAIVGRIEADGFAVDYAYGDAQTDFEAYSDARLPVDHQFSIGLLAGYGGTNAIRSAGYDEHMATFQSTVPAVCDPAITPPGPAAGCPTVHYDGLLPWFSEQVFHVPQADRLYPCH